MSPWRNSLTALVLGGLALQVCAIAMSGAAGCAPIAANVSLSTDDGGHYVDPEEPCVTTLRIDSQLINALARRAVSAILASPSVVSIAEKPRIAVDGKEFRNSGFDSPAVQAFIQRLRTELQRASDGRLIIISPERSRDDGSAGNVDAVPADYDFCLGGEITQPLGRRRPSRYRFLFELYKPGTREVVWRDEYEYEWIAQGMKPTTNSGPEVLGPRLDLHLQRRAQADELFWWGQYSSAYKVYQLSLPDNASAVSENRVRGTAWRILVTCLLLPDCDDLQAHYDRFFAQRHKGYETRFMRTSADYIAAWVMGMCEDDELRAGLQRLELNAGLSKAWFLIGERRRAAGDLAGARKAYQAAVDLRQPDDLGWSSAWARFRLERLPPVAEPPGATKPAPDTAPARTPETAPALRPAY